MKNKKPKTMKKSESKIKKTPMQKLSLAEKAMKGLGHIDAEPTVKKDKPQAIVKRKPDISFQSVTVKKEVTLIVGANIFGFQFRKYTTLIIDDNGLYVKEPFGFNEIPLGFFHKQKEDFIAEAEKANATFINIQQNGEVPAYSIDFENTTNKPLVCTLFGMNEHLLSKNHGSAKGIVVKPTQTEICYLEQLQQSSCMPFRTKMIKVISDNREQLLSVLTIKSKDANGSYMQNPLNTIAYMTDDVKNVLPIAYHTIVNGNTQIQFTVQPKTKGTILFYAEKPNASDIIDELTLDLFNAIMSCQIQQGLNFVSINNIARFKNNSTNGELVRLNKLIKIGMIKTVNENAEVKYGVNFRLLNVDGKIVDVDLLTALKKSEFDIKK